MTLSSTILVAMVCALVIVVSVSNLEACDFCFLCHHVN
uniref:Uncharacterized protein n=1 Tax=Rhizophora mucronata TaxID=61149 RepID=A0A2P2PSF8_RHIMU